MTEHERELIGAWYVQGAKIPDDAKMPVAQPQPAAMASNDAVEEELVIRGATPAERANNYFKTICAGCHGFGGQGDGIASGALNPKPRNFTDAAWQASVTDQHIRDIIARGGKAMGKSALMPPQPPLARDAATLDALVKLVRGFGPAKETHR
jgi:cytochrome c551/c552